MAAFAQVVEDLMTRKHCLVTFADIAAVAEELQVRPSVLLAEAESLPLCEVDYEFGYIRCTHDKVMAEELRGPQPVEA